MGKKHFHQKGFSLVELMVVVALIAILAAIGIPNYKKHRMKAYQSEAKASLSTVFVAEASFNVEFGFYHTSLKAIGFLPLGKTRYNVGFGQAGFVPPEYTATFPAATMATKTTCAGAFGLGTDTSCDLIIDTPDIANTATASASAFQVTAVGYEDQLMASCRNPNASPIEMIAALTLLGNESHASGNSIDGWVINEQKLLSQKVLLNSGGACVTNLDCPGGQVCVAFTCQ